MDSSRQHDTSEMEISAIGAVRWVVGKALGPVTDGLLEAWAASSTLGPKIRALKLELLYAQGMLDNARGRNVRSPALRQLLLELRHLAYAADDVLDELDYFRIQDELDGTYETVDDASEEKGLVRGVFFHARHTARAMAGKLKCCSCAAAAGRVEEDPDDISEQEYDAKRGRCVSLTAATHAVGKRLPCCSLSSVHGQAAAGVPVANERRFICVPCSSKKQHRKNAPKLKFDRVEMSQKITDIAEQLKPVCAKVATILGLQSSGPNLAKSQGTDFDRRLKTTPQIIEPELYGREIQKKTLVDKIVNGKYSGNDLTVLPIFGPGGIGKTTFIQHIYNKLKSHFHVSVWICVSQNFNANKLAEEIVKQMPKASNEKENESHHELIEKRIQSKRFLLVLDDMWTYHEDEWKKLLAPFRKGGTKHNIVMVTTRIPKVAKMVESPKDCSTELKPLEHDDCMQLFQACVFGDKKSWEDQDADLKEVGINIVKKINGIPLAIKTVGRLLRVQLNLDRWKSVLESKEWQLQDNDDDIMPALKLSYNSLPFQLQQCFSYCALFPEDYRFGREELINLWIGLGLLDVGDHKTIEDIGISYLNDLVEYGFFIQDGKDYDSTYLVHDLLHELATHVSSYESLRINSSDVRSIQIPTSIRHISVIIDNTYVKDRMTFENRKEELSILGKKMKAGNLRTIMLFGEHHGSFLKIFGDTLRDAKSVRVIYLSGASYKIEDLFHNFSRFVHLRYLRVKDSSNSEASLPSNISRFYHLLVLDIENHFGKLRFLSDMGNLMKLRHLLVPDNTIYSRIPEVGKLKLLKELQRFEVKREKEGFELKQIGQLLELQGSLCIHNLEKVDSINEADEVKLSHMKHLGRLELNWDNDGCSKDHIGEGNVLESLKPHNNLRELCIAGNGGATCPNWLHADLSVKNLDSLHLKGVNWNILPLPGKLYMTNGEEHQSGDMGEGFHNLKSLELIQIGSLKKWHGNGTINLLPHLQNLTVSDCPELTELPFPCSTDYQSRSEVSTNFFPKLQTVSISKCPKLVSFPPLPIPWTRALRSVRISGVASGFRSLEYKHEKNSQSILSIDENDAQDGLVWNMLDMNNLIEVQQLTISNCSPISLHHLKMLTCLKTLEINNSSDVLLLDDESDAQCELPAENISIRVCRANGKELTKLLSHFPNLSTLDLLCCPNLKGLGVTMTAPESTQVAEEGMLLLPPKIQKLNILMCQELNLYCSSSFDGDGGTAAVQRGGLQGLHSLRYLWIDDCPRLLSSSPSSSLYSPFPTSLPNLTLQGVLGMESLQAPPRGIFRHLLAQGQLTQLRVCGIPNFFLGSELFHSSPVDGPNINCISRLQELVTNDIAGVLAAPICRLLSSSLTSLVLISINEVERFTKEQEEALQNLTSIQKLQFQSCNKLQSLPAGLGLLPSLKMLQIFDCPSMSSLGDLPDSLQQLRIYYSQAINSLPKDSLPSSLQEIDVRHSGNKELKRQCHKLKGVIPVIADY